MSLSLNEYQDRTFDTALYPGANEGTLAAVVYCALGLGESGEVQGKVKKIIRDDGAQITDDHRYAIAQELGDNLWYLARMAKEVGFSLDEVAQMNLDKLASRRERGVVGGSGDNR